MDIGQLSPLSSVIVALGLASALVTFIAFLFKIDSLKLKSAVVTVIILGCFIGVWIFSSSNPSTKTPTPSKSGTQTAVNARVTPTATPSPTPTPKVIPENLNIPCINCQGAGFGTYALTLKLKTITIDYANQQTIMNYMLTNIGTVSCTVIFNTLEFQDENGTSPPYKAQNVGQSLGDIAVGNPLVGNSTFDFLPRPNAHYFLNISIDCTNRIDFKTQDFVFN